MTGPTAYAADSVLVSAAQPCRTRSAVLVRDGRIVAVVGSHEIPAEYKTVDLGHSWLMPGLIDMHVHLVWDGGSSPDSTLSADSAELTALKSARRAEDHLRNGITTVRDCGAPHAIILAVRAAIDRGVALGARVLASGELISRAGDDGMSIHVHGPGQAREAVRSLAGQGVNLIKVRATQGVFAPGENLAQLDLEPDELAAAVTEARHLGLRVAAHAYSIPGIRNAISARVDTLEHASFLDGEAAAAAAAGGQTLVPTLLAYSRYLQPATTSDLPAEAVRKAQSAYTAGQDAVAHALDRGVPIAVGSDAGGRAKPHGHLAGELEELVRAGLTPAEAIAAATTAAARALGRDDLGALTTGSHADIIGMPADPTADIHALRDIQTVIAAGHQIQ